MRRDMRLKDNTALNEALTDSEQVAIVFIFDDVILKKLKPSDKRMTIIWNNLVYLNKIINEKNNDNVCVQLYFGNPIKVIPQIIEENNIQALYFNRDYEPYAKKRDNTVVQSCENIEIDVHHFRDHVLVEAWELKNKQGGFYKVFTPYKNSWFQFVHQRAKRLIPKTVSFKNKLFNLKSKFKSIKSLKDLDFEEQEISLKCVKPELADTLLSTFARQKCRDYAVNRDFPGIEGISRLSVYLRFGVLSSRQIIKKINHYNEVHFKGLEVYQSELVWREFYQMILWAYPFVEKKSFKAQYDNIKWLGTRKNFNLWAKGMTGFPLIDAAMREFNETGLMHNRLRMVVASFLIKDLQCDWRWGERYFAEHLLDFDLAANSGGWQWCASSGCDAQPYFRIFNPSSQSKRFDADGEYIKRHLPELKNLPKKYLHEPWLMTPVEQASLKCVLGKDYPRPIVDHREARYKTLKMYDVVKSKKVTL